MFSSQQISNSFIGRVLFTVAILTLFLLTGYLFLKMAHILLILFMGILLAVILDTLMNFLIRRLKIPRGLAFAIVIIFLLSITAAVVFLIGPGIIDQLVLLSQRLPKAYAAIKAFIMKSKLSSQLLQDINRPGEVLPPLSVILGGISGVFSITLGTLLSIFIAIFTGIYLALQPDYYITKVLKIIPINSRGKAEEVIRMAGRALRWWFFGRFISMMIVGVFMAIGLAIAGIPFAITLGLIAAMLCFIPYIGPILSAVPPILVAMTVSTHKIVYALIVYLVVQLSESYIITPIVQKRAVFIPPAFLFTAQVMMGVIAGPLGLVLATPLAVIMIVTVQKLYIHDILGDTVIMLGEHRHS
jgi:predicted PurR-regulated permease PerM